MPFPLLEIEQLTVGFVNQQSDVDVVRQLSFIVEAGAITALVGESGSGKSVTAMSVMGLLNKQVRNSGSIWFSEDGSSRQDLLLMNEAALRMIRGAKIAMIFQEPMTSLNPLMSCGMQVVEAIRQHRLVSKREAKQEALQLFQKVQLPDPEQMFNKYPHQISGGQQQRVMIAMAVSCRPKLLIADEPTTALDVTVQKSVLDLLRKLSHEMGMGILLITHDLGLVADYASFVRVMYRGELAESGITDRVLPNPAAAYTRALLACRPAGKPPGSRLPVVSDFMMGDKVSVASAAVVYEPEPVLPKTAIEQDILQVDKLSVHYPVPGESYFRAVHEVSFSIQKAETVGLVGESGCGKTTLGRAILQLIPYTSGTVRIQGRDLAGLSSGELRQLRKEMQVVFQDPYGSLNPRLTIGEALAEPVGVHKLEPDRVLQRQRVMQMLDRVQLPQSAFHRYPHEFSGGQRQRLCIARALVLDPSFLVFDESVSALDVSVQAQILNLINDLKRDLKFAALFISHDLSVVQYISDRLLIMKQGAIVESGITQQVYSNPTHEYTRRLLSAIPGKALV